MTGAALADFDPTLDAPRAGHALVDYDSGPAIERGLFAAWVFVASEAMFFAGLFSAYVLLRGASPAWDAHHASLSRGAALAGTVLLLASSWTMSRAVRGASSGTSHRAGAWIAATLALGVTFLTLQGFEYGALLGDGLRPSTDLPWSCFYVLTGIHGLHVLGGIAWIAWAAWTSRAALDARRAGSASARVTALEAASVYWHFVDVVWIALCATLYFA